MTVRLNGFDVRMLRAAGKLEDLKTPLRRSETYMERSIGNRFRTAAWVPLAASTLVMHPHRAGGKPLNDTGALKQSITSGAANRLSKRKLTIRSGLKKANLHNHGGRTSWGTFVPARPFLFFSGTDRQMIQRVFDDYVDELVREVNDGNH
ncbi:phage virion morphogenesis protein [Bacillus thuringiensis]|uniref:phage virion morphogenesis protein n=1 Tax=Bacillus thuringiensis TaxID=1428 RepID=UPI00159C210D